MPYNKDMPLCLYDILQDMEGCIKVILEAEEGKSDFYYKLH